TRGAVSHGMQANCHFPRVAARGEMTIADIPWETDARDQLDSRISRISRAVSDGVLPTLTPTASRASCLAWAVPDEPETIAPAWPMVLPSGAVKPATAPTTGFVRVAL